MNGFDWLNLAGLQSDNDLPPPPVSFGVTPTSSSSSLNLKSQSTSQPLSEPVPAVRLNDKLVETAEDLSVPLSLRADELTRDEAKTYLRWYNDIVVRRGTNQIRLDDVFQFLRNFSISQQCKDMLTRIFREVNSLNVGEFFAFLRVIAHTILGQTPMRRLIKKPAPIPKPKSILSAKRVQDPEDEQEDEHLESNNTQQQPASFDLDSFTQMLLTGENPSDTSNRNKKKKKKGHSKRIKFSDQVSVEPTQVKTMEPVKIDLSLPMDQLLNNMPKNQQHQPTATVNEEEELKEMQDSFSHFRNIKNVDSALIHGTPSNIPSIFFDEMNGTRSPNLQSPSPDPAMRPMAPNHTGPVLPLAHMNTGPSGGVLSPNYTGSAPFANSFLQPNMTGPAPPQPLLQQQQQQQNGLLQPNYTGITDQNGFLQPSMTGSYRPGSVSPQIHNPPAAPPTRRSRSASSPIPLENQHVSLEQLAMSVSKDRIVSDPPQYQQQQQQQQQQQLQPPTLAELQAQRVPSPNAPAPPPPRRRGMSQPPAPPPSRLLSGPPLPPKIEIGVTDYNSFRQQQQQQIPQYQQNNYQQPQQQQQYQQQQQQQQNGYQSSATDILGDLKALQSEVDRIQYYQN